jgi:pimeloyl-ACP methyl ester carboxylesterase
VSKLVLIHGGWHGGWCWRKVARQLRNQGHDVFTPSLTGMGEREHLWTPEVGLTTHTEDILNLIRVERLDDAILVGHSYGGAIVTLVADQIPSKLRALVYVDAIIPEDGVPGWDGFPEHRKREMLADAEKLGGLRVPPPDPSMWGISKEEDVAWLRGSCSPHPIKSMYDKPRLNQNWQAVAIKHYIVAGASANPRFLAHYYAVQNQIGWTSEVIDGGHDLMITEPLALSAALQRIAALCERP